MVSLVYPHQLYEQSPALADASEVWLIEDPLFFRQFHFHRQKLILHRASMQAYREGLLQGGYRVRYVECGELEETESIAELLKAAGHQSARVVDPSDDWLSRKLRAACRQSAIELELLPDPHFLTGGALAEAWKTPRNRYYFTEFYIQQRKALGLLVEQDGKPTGERWTFDVENRKRLPAGKLIPNPLEFGQRAAVLEAERYVETHFPKALGARGDPFPYPITPDEASAWLEDFLAERLHDFGAYEDAISASQPVLFHSVLTPALNIGLLTPRQILDATLKYRDRVPLNSLEGFVRQVAGWREFVRLVYLGAGRRQRTRNELQHTHSMPSALYDGTTGIPPVDAVIRRTLQTGYCHHIERLMILGNFMTLTEIDPDAVYRWFMELFIDAYDWVMVPNVYGMSQYADGGLMTTKPYISGSNYILKMSDFPPGDWCEVWDGLYWRFIAKHRDMFLKNPRLRLAVSALDRLGDRLPRLLARAEAFLAELHGSNS